MAERVGTVSERNRATADKLEGWTFQECMMAAAYPHVGLSRRGLVLLHRQTTLVDRERLLGS